MKTIFFHMQGYRDLPDDFHKKYPKNARPVIGPSCTCGMNETSKRTPDDGLGRRACASGSAASVRLTMKADKRRGRVCMSGV